MSILLLRLSGPMQSWGIQSRFSMRDTGLEPSKSGVIGLLCAALGKPRTDPLSDLAALNMDVRVDREGVLRSDYHTAQNVLKADGGRKDTELSTRYYLADACFLVGLQGEDTALLTRLHAALRNPVWPLYLGRKSFVPGESVWLADGLIDHNDRLATLHAYPTLVSPQRGSQPQSIRLIMENPTGVDQRRDVPLSFASRTFAVRSVSTTFAAR